MDFAASTPMRLAHEGSLFVCTNPTLGTPAATGTSVPASFSATAPMFVVKNNAPANSGICTWLHSLAVVQIGGTAPASTTSVQSAVVVDSGDRTPTSGTQLLTPVNTVHGGRASTTQVWAVPPTGSGANMVAPAAVSARTIARRQVKGGATVLLDEYDLLFGGEGPLMKMANSAVGTFSSRYPAVRLLPQHFALIYLWFPGGNTNAFTHEFEMVLSER